MFKMDDMGSTVTTTKTWKMQEDYTAITSSLHEAGDTVEVELFADQASR